MKYTLVALMMVLCCVGCFEGPMGPKGEDGAQGVSGVDGMDGGGTEIVLTGVLTADMKNDNGNWDIFRDINTDGITGVMAFCGGQGVWIRSPMWGYAAADGKIYIMIANNDQPDGEVQLGWEYKIVVFYQ